MIAMKNTQKYLILCPKNTKTCLHIIPGSIHIISGIFISYQGVFMSFQGVFTTPRGVGIFDEIVLFSYGKTSFFSPFFVFVFSIFLLKKI